MSMTSDLYTILTALSIPAQIGDYQAAGALPDTYAVILPLYDNYQAADDAPDVDVESASVELYTKGDWHSAIKSIKTQALAKGMCISESRYITRETDTRYFHYSVSFQMEYND